MGVPLAAYNIRPPQPQEGPLESYAKIMSLKSMLQRQQAGEMEIQDRQQTMAEEKAIRQAFTEAGSDFRKALPKIRQVSPRFAMVVQKAIIEDDQRASDEKFKERQETRLEAGRLATEKHQADTLGETREYHRGLLAKEKPAPTLTESDKEIDDYLAARGLPKTPFNRDKARFELKQRNRVSPTEGRDIEGEASDYADALEAGTIQWPQVPTAHGLRSRTMAAINKRGAVILSPKQREGLQSGKRAESIINTIDAASKRVHSGARVPGQKWVSGLAETAESVAAPAGNPDLEALQTGKAALGPIIRNLGEMGNLSEGDIQRALAAVPVSRFLTRKEAESRIATLREFVKASQDAIQAVAGKSARELFPSGGTSAPPGATMKVPGSDGKLHWSDGKQDLGVVQ